MVSDGPFAETREQVAGYDVIDCADLDEAIEIASKYPTAWYGTIEVRPIAGKHCRTPTELTPARHASSSRRTRLTSGSTPRAPEPARVGAHVLCYVVRDGR